MEETRLCRCSMPLKPDQARYCSTACRLEGMRAAKALKRDVHVDDAIDKDARAAMVLAEAAADDWRRPKQATEAMQSYHRRPPGWA